jgi:MFS family permease
VAPEPGGVVATSLGLRANAGQFALLVGVGALVGAMVGQERAVLPLMATRIFGVPGVASALTFLIAFGITKALTNLVAGILADRYGRRPVLVAGWLAGLPVPLLLIWAPSWEWIVAANLLLGVNQGLTWSVTVLMKVDLVGPLRRGFALGLNEAAGYGAVAVTALATGFIADRAGLRPAPFVLGLGIALAGLLVSALAVRETRDHVRLEDELVERSARPSWRTVVLKTTVREPSLSAASQAGLVNNLNDGMAWGLLPLFYAAAGLSLPEIGVLAAAYPLTWGVAQLVTGAASDRFGRKGLIVVGLLVQAASIAAIAGISGFVPWLGASVALGIGTAMVYPTLLAAVADVADPTWRGSALGVYRMWRDLGFAAGAILVGAVADRAGMAAAVVSVAAITAASAVVVAVRMVETHPRLGAHGARARIPA